MKKQKSYCKICDRELPRSSFPTCDRGWLRGRVCTECVTKQNKKKYAEHGAMLLGALRHRYHTDREYREKCRNRSRKYALSERENRPWRATLRSIRYRCGKVKAYLNIKNRLSESELEYMWYRDRAGDMKKPSIDRIDPRKDYVLENCRYLEMADNYMRSVYFDERFPETYT